MLVSLKVLLVFRIHFLNIKWSKLFYSLIFWYTFRVNVPVAKIRVHNSAIYYLLGLKNFQILLPLSVVIRGGFMERKFVKVLLKQFTMYTLGKIFVRQGIFATFLCDRVQGLERLFAHPRHLPCQVPLGL